MSNSTITEILKECKHNQFAIQEIIGRFQPLIGSYSRKGGWKIETEDMCSILTIKLIEIVQKMEVSESEAKNVAYIAKVLKNCFLDTIRQINRLENIEFVGTDKMVEAGVFDEDNAVFADMIKILDEKKREIIILKFKYMYTDQEIATQLGMSRQGVHKHLKRAYEKLST